jgi:hypothetical protein
MPGFSFSTVGPLCVGSPPTRYGLPTSRTLGTMIRYDCQQPVSGFFAFARPPIPCILLFHSCPVFLGSPGGPELSHPLPGLLFIVITPSSDLRQGDRWLSQVPALPP